MMRGLYGKACHVVREDEVAARSLGIDIDHIRLTMLLLSAAYGARGGRLFAHVNRIASPEALEFKTMVLCLTMAVVGGRTRIAGAIIGALLIVHLPRWFRFLDRSYVMVNAIILIGLLIVAPEGLIGIIDRILPKPRGVDTGEGERHSRLRPKRSPRGAARCCPPPRRSWRCATVGKRVRRRESHWMTCRSICICGTITAVIGPNAALGRPRW